MNLSRVIYFTSIVGDDDALHNARVTIREHGLDPQVIREAKNLEKQRTILLDSDGVIEKAKGVDIGLAVRMIEDAYMNHYQACLLFTSDVDFMPAIQAVRKLGKHVIVAGYRKGLGQRSPLEFEPDGFRDLESYMKKEYGFENRSVPNP